MTGEKIGLLLDSLGVRLELAEGDMVTDAVVVAKVVTGDGVVAVGLAMSESTSWLEQLGLITAASEIIRANPAQLM